MKARIRKGMLIVTIPVIDPPRPSKSGKRLLVANSHSFRRTSAKVGKKPVAVNLIAAVHPDEQQDKQEKLEISKSKVSPSRSGKRKARPKD